MRLTDSDAVMVTAVLEAEAQADAAFGPETHRGTYVETDWAAWAADRGRGIVRPLGYYSRVTEWPF